jgi:hypothetical protein
MLGFICWIPRITHAADVPVNFSGGTGSASDPYLIANTDDLAELSARVEKEVGEKSHYRFAHYLQTADIDLSSLEKWTPIGKFEDTVDNSKMIEHAFAGVYNGSNYKIINVRNLLNDNKRDYASYGLFGIVSGDCAELGIVKNIRMENSFSIFLEKNLNFGAIVGGMTGGKLENCVVEGGGIKVYSKETSQNQDLALRLAVGGLVGNARGGSVIINCVNKGPIFINSKELSIYLTWVGGIAGIAAGSRQPVVIQNSRNDGSIELSLHNGDVGGIAGVGQTIINCRNTRDINIEADSSIRCGGITGRTLDNIARCYNEGKIRIASLNTSLKGVEVGGLAGSAKKIEESANNGDILVELNYKNKSGVTKYDNGSYMEYFSVEVACGGLVGNKGMMLNVVNTGDITGIISSEGLPTNIYLGGIGGSLGVSHNNKSLVEFQNVLNLGSVNLKELSPGLNSYVGGIVGYVFFKRRIDKSIVRDCYWLEGSSTRGVGNSSGFFNTLMGMGSVDPIMLTPAELGHQESFTGLDFENVWVMSEKEPKIPILRIFSGID